ncbi:hypothetical protein V3W47_10750 [Deinococcus sp. YIM 134068]|uniref:hypothetical protein n=1 Tax=Deinococcus lichenicola TaxID=3118910 RepID=UPI002F92DE33
MNHWQGAGLTFQDLVDVVELASGAWANDDHEGFLQRRALRYVRRAYPTPTVTHAKPDRMTFALEDLPMLEDVRPADSAHPWPYFEDGEGKKVDVLAGPDALILTLAGDVRAVLYTGIHGQTYHKARPEAPGFQVPPRLWPAVTAALSGPHGVLPSLTGVDVDAGGVTLTLDLYGKSSRYSLTARARYTAREPHALGLPYRVTFPEVLDRGREFFALALWVPADLWRAFRTALPHGVVRGPARPA